MLYSIVNNFVCETELCGIEISMWRILPLQKMLIQWMMSLSSGLHPRNTTIDSHVFIQLVISLNEIPFELPSFLEVWLMLGTPALYMVKICDFLQVARKLTLWWAWPKSHRYRAFYLSVWVIPKDFTSARQKYKGKPKIEDPRVDGRNQFYDSAIARQLGLAGKPRWILKVWKSLSVEQPHMQPIHKSPISENKWKPDWKVMANTILIGFSLDSFFVLFWKTF